MVRLLVKVALSKCWEIFGRVTFLFIWITCGITTMSCMVYSHSTGNSKLSIHFLTGISPRVSNEANSAFCWLGFVIVVVCHHRDQCTYAYIESKSVRVTARGCNPEAPQRKGAFHSRELKTTKTTTTTHHQHLHKLQHQSPCQYLNIHFHHSYNWLQLWHIYQHFCHFRINFIFK